MMKGMNMRRNTTTWLLIAGLNMASPLINAQNSDTGEVIKRLERRIEELEQKVRNLEGTNGQAPPANVDHGRIEGLDQKVKALERRRELDQEAEVERAKSLPTVSLGLNGLVVRSADTNFLMNLHGYV